MALSQTEQIVHAKTLSAQQEVLDYFAPSRQDAVLVKTEEGSLLCAHARMELLR